MIYTLPRTRADTRYGGGTTVNYVSAYTQEELIDDLRRRARGEHLSCPSCGWTDPPDRERRLFDIYLEKGRSGGLGYSYRLCKVCGFAQDADGGECYRVWLSTHLCQPRRPPSEDTSLRCRHCDRTVAVVNGVAEAHQCGKYLRRGDSGYCCSTCGVWQGPASARPLPGDRRKTVRAGRQSSAA